MNYLRDYMTVRKEDFEKQKPGWNWRFFPDLQKQNEHFAETMVARIKQAQEDATTLAVVLPTGPIDFQPFVDKVNAENVSLENLHVFMMDEYCRDAQTLIEKEHPLSFRDFINHLLFEGIRPELRMKEENLLFPDPADPAAFDERIKEVGGIDIVFAGFGLNGHLAFNDPPDDPESCTVENVRDTQSRVVRLSRETISQNALGGTRGLLELVPPLAVTIGMKPMIEASEIHLYLLRKWHSGIFRRCLFGPVTPRVPGSFVQQHSDVTICMPNYVAEVPNVVVTLDV